YTRYSAIHRTVRSDMECAPCMHLRASMCPYFTSNYTDCNRRVDAAVIGSHVAELYAASKGTHVAHVVDSSPYATSVHSNDLHPTRVNVAVLLDYAGKFTGGGFYLWQIAHALAERGD